MAPNAKSTGGEPSVNVIPIRWLVSMLGGTIGVCVVCALWISEKQASVFEAHIDRLEQLVLIDREHHKAQMGELRELFFRVERKVDAVIASRK